MHSTTFETSFSNGINIAPSNTVLQHKPGREGGSELTLLISSALSDSRKFLGREIFFTGDGSQRNLIVDNELRHTHMHYVSYSSSAFFASTDDRIERRILAFSSLNTDAASYAFIGTSREKMSEPVALRSAGWNTTGLTSSAPVENGKSHDDGNHGNHRPTSAPP